MDQQTQSQQIFCPVCKGGSPTTALRCMWCGNVLVASMPPVQVERKPGNRTGVLLFAMLVLAIVGIGGALISANGNVAGLRGRIGSTHSPSTQSFTGSGPQASKSFPLSEGLARFHTVASGGTGNFGAWLMDDSGNKLELLANTIGSIDTTKAVNIAESGRFLVQVDYWDGKWTITVDQ